MNIHVAIVDDDDSVCRSLGRLLSIVGIESVSYGSAEAFIADPEYAGYDCLVLDIQLGGMSGLELQARLVAESCPVPVLFITAHEDAASRLRAESLGCVGFFRKTDPGTHIIDAIRSAAPHADGLDTPGHTGQAPAG